MITVKTTTEEKNKPKPFPKLMISETGIIILFRFPEVGTVVKADSVLSAGDWGESWDMQNFTDYNEPITIQNA